jgi:acyl-CoA dehydrogenase
MAIDFTLSPEHEEIRTRVRAFIDEVVKPGEAAIEGHGDSGTTKPATGNLPV